MKVDFAKLQHQYQLYKFEIDEAIQSVLNKSNYIMGEEVQQLEESLQSFTGAKYAITCSSGTDALLLAMMSLDIQPGDEVITTPFTFIATAEIIALLGAKPVFVDIEETTYNIDISKIKQAITTKTKALLPVSLYGQPADLDEIQAIAKKYELQVIIDGAQSFGSLYKNRTDSSLGDISCTSFFPAKPLGCYGDGGAVFTNNSELAEKIRSLRVHGQIKRYHHKYIGLGARLDTLQAAVLNVKLHHYEEELKNRQTVAEKYNNELSHLSSIITPKLKNNRTSVWAQYSIRVNKRDAVQNKLKENGIPTAIHYPKPLHLQECFNYLGYKTNDFPIAEKVSQEIVSLPMNAFLSDNEIEFVCNKLLCE